jgi:hypothetical protein
MESQSFNHIAVLVVVLNAIGLGTLMIGIAGFLRQSPKQTLKPSGVLIAWFVLHVYLHVMLWWRFYGLDLVASFNFFDYLFMLSGPMCLLFGSALLLPDEEDGTIDMPAYLDRIYGRLFSIEAIFWVWALLFGPLLTGKWESVWYLWAIMVAISLLLALTRARSLRIALTGAAWLVQLVFIANAALMLR